VGAGHSGCRALENNLITFINIDLAKEVPELEQAIGWHPHILDDEITLVAEQVVHDFDLAMVFGKIGT